MENIKNRLKQITDLLCASGYEKNIAEYIIKEISPFVSEIKVDSLGNVIAHKRGNGKKSLALCTHTDKAAFIVNHIEDDAKVRISSYGISELSNLLYRNVSFSGGARGVILPDAAFENDKSAQNIYVDIGVRTKKEAQKKVKLSEAVCLCAGELDICKDAFYGEGLDAALGIYALCECAKEVGENTDDIYFIFASQNYAMYAGAQTAANMDISFALSVGTVSAKEEKGLVLFAKDANVVYPKSALIYIERILEKSNIDYTVRADEKEKSDAYVYKLGGALGARLCVQTENTGTAAERIKLESAEEMKKALIEICRSGVEELYDNI